MARPSHKVWLLLLALGACGPGPERRVGPGLEPPKANPIHSDATAPTAMQPIQGVDTDAQNSPTPVAGAIAGAPATTAAPGVQAPAVPPASGPSADPGGGAPIDPVVEEDDDAGIPDAPVAADAAVIPDAAVTPDAAAVTRAPWWRRLWAPRGVQP